MAIKTYVESWLEGFDSGVRKKALQKMLDLDGKFFFIPCLSKDNITEFYNENKEEINNILASLIEEGCSPQSSLCWDKDDPLALKESNQRILSRVAFMYVAKELNCYI